MTLALAVPALVALGLIAVVRLAPSDPAVWHPDLAAEGFRPPRNGQVFCIRTGTRQGPGTDARALLAGLDAIAMAGPRTERLAGSAAAGRITWITRSALIGYPDYTTAQAMPGSGPESGPGLCILGRQRFGGHDWGVNVARIGAWVQALLGLDAPPPMTGFRGRGRMPPAGIFGPA